MSTEVKMPSQISPETALELLTKKASMFKILAEALHELKQAGYMLDADTIKKLGKEYGIEIVPRGDGTWTSHRGK